MKLFQKFPTVITFIFFMNLAFYTFSQSSHISYNVTQLVLPSITSISGAEGICESYTTQFVVTATGDSLTFQWYHDSINIGNSNNDTLFLNNASVTDAGSYFCIISNCAGSDTSSATYLTVYATGVTVTDTINKILHDGRDCQNYQIVKIGNQWWMSKNLNVGTMVNSTETGLDHSDQFNNSIIEKYCLDNDPTNCSTYGGLYEWRELMQYSISDTTQTSTTQGICPSGWHLPNDNEWKILEISLGMSQSQADSIDARGTNQGTQLKEGGSSGFEGLYGGYRGYDGSFNFGGFGGLWWSATGIDSIRAWDRDVRDNTAQVYRTNHFKLNGFSARCIYTQQSPCITITVTNNTLICQGQTLYVGTSAYTVSGTYIDSLITTLGCDSIITTNLSVYATGETVTDTINKILHDGRDCHNYPIVKIGNQWWMAENLKTKKFRNSDTITNGTGAGNISSITKPKYWFVYNDDEANENTYGLMYTWHALTDNRHICATGWHEAKNNEWQELFNFLGGDTIAGAKMKESGTSHWNSPNSGATNESGFTALPSGARGNNGTFANLGASGRFWSGSEFNSTNAWRYELTSASSAVINANGNKSNGFSVRCLINNCSDIFVNNSINICLGQSYSVGTHTYNINGTYIDTINLVSGCDSIITTNLTVNQTYSISESVAICSGDSVFLNGNWQTSGGTYYDTLSSVNGCDSIIATTLTLKPSPNPNLGNDTSYCTNTGINLIASGGGSSDFIWNTGATSQQIFVSVSDTYSVTVTNIFGCSKSDVIYITLYPVPSVSLGNDTSACTSIAISANASGGSGTYSYQWSSGCNEITCNVLTSGLLYVTVSDDTGCFASDNINISIWSLPDISISGSDSVCQGENTILTSVISGGTSPFTYNWSPGYSVMNSYTFTPQQSTNYQLIVSDAHQCKDTATHFLTVIQNPVTSAITGSVNSNTGETKTYSVTNNTGNTYNWTVTGGSILSGQGSSQVDVFWSDQGVGIVCVTETNIQGCTGTQICIQVNVGFSCTGFGVTLQKQNPKCFNTCNGYINTIVTGGTAPYTYLWNDSQQQTGNMAVNLCEGSYNVTVHDQYQCTSIASANIVSPEEILILITTSDADCSTDNGSAFATVTGGTQPYTYAWTNGDTLMNASNLASGMYMLTVTDNEACSVFTLVTINDQNGPVISIDSIINLTCNQSHNGAIDISVTEGTSPYFYNWSDGAVTQDISGLEAGPYEIQVTDTNNCTASMIISVQQPAPLNVNVTTTESNCGTANGTAYVNVSGGTAPYTFLWNTNGTLQNPTEMPAGMYYVSVTDSHGCTNNNGTMVAINNNSGPQITIDSLTSASCNGSDGAIYITTSGGAAPYQFNWSDSTAYEDNSGITAGNYSITVTDNNGCIGTGMATVTSVLLATPQICMVLVDSTVTKNLIIWEKEITTGINHYNIYREGSWAGSYFLIGSKNYSELSTFMDLTSHPMNRSYRYQITSVDQCNNESQRSIPHKTMFLAINEGIGNNWNLQWSDYEGFSFPGYYIWRHTQTIGWELLDSIAVGYNFYSDNPPSQGQLKYLVSARAPYICNPTSGKEMTGPFSQSLSNIEDNGIILSSKNALSDFSVELFPNPAKSKVFIKSLKAIEIKVYNIIGEMVYNGNTNESNYVILHHKGIYIFEISDGKNISYKKVVVQ